MIIKVSVLLPAFNASLYIEEAINSILSQSLSDFELIIVNDGSTDDTEKKVLQYADKRIVYIRLEKNEGIANALNAGLRLARGEYIARMDCDDIALKDRLKKQVDFLDEHKDITLCSSGVKTFGAYEKEVLYETNNEKLKFNLLFGSVFVHPAVMFRKADFDKYHLQYRQEYFPAEDYDLWTRVALQCKISNLSEPLLLYRVHKDQITQTNKKAFEKCTEIQYHYLENTLCLDKNKLSTQSIVRYVLQNNSFENIESLNQLWGNYNILVEANKRSKFFIEEQFEIQLKRVVQNRIYNGLNKQSLKNLYHFRGLVVHLRMVQILKLLLR